MQISNHRWTIVEPKRLFRRSIAGCPIDARLLPKKRRCATITSKINSWNYPARETYDGPGLENAEQTMRRSLPLLAVMLCACTSSVEPKIEENVLPINYKPKLINLMNAEIDDPSAISDAYISEPALKPIDKTNRYIVCFRYNVKSRDGKIAASKNKAAVYYAGAVTQIIEADRDLCGNLNYQPFPELEKICRGPKCP